MALAPVVCRCPEHGSVHDQQPADQQRRQQPVADQVDGPDQGAHHHDQGQAQQRAGRRQGSDRSVLELRQHSLADRVLGRRFPRGGAARRRRLGQAVRLVLRDALARRQGCRSTDRTRTGRAGVKPLLGYDCYDVQDSTADQLYKPEKLVNGVWVINNWPVPDQPRRDGGDVAHQPAQGLPVQEGQAQQDLRERLSHGHARFRAATRTARSGCTRRASRTAASRA